MFDQILELVKQHIGNNPQISSAIPADKKEAVNNEIASHVTNGLQNHAASQGGAGGLLSMLQNAVTSGSPVTNAIEGGLISSLASKFGLPPMATGALPGLLQKFAHKAADPNDNSITTESITNSVSGKLGGLGNLFNK